MRPLPTLLLLLFLSILLLSACGPSRWPDYEQVGQGERMVIKFSHVAAENSVKGQAARRFAALVKERTAGRVEVQIFANGALFSDAEELDALKSDSVQMIAPATSQLTALNPAWQVFDLPYLFPDTGRVERLIASQIGQQLYDDLAKRQIEPLALWHDGMKQLTNAQNSLIMPEDLRELRFVIAPSPVLQEFFTAAKASAAVHPFPSHYGLLERGEADGQESTPSVIWAKRFHEVQPYMTITNHSYLGYVVLINGRSWSQLPPEVRETIREAMADTTQWVREHAGRINAEALERLTASGKLLIHQQTPNERELWRHHLRPVYAAAEQRLTADFMQEVIQTVRNP